MTTLLEIEVSIPCFCQISMSKHNGKKTLVHFQNLKNGFLQGISGKTRKIRRNLIATRASMKFLLFFNISLCGLILAVDKYVFRKA